MSRAIKVLLELRPALDGHSGIPQETRLLFRGLALLEGIDVAGLIQSSNLVLDEGVPTRGGREVPGLSSQERIDRLSKFVVSIQQGPASHRLDTYRRRLLRLIRPLFAVVRSSVGGTVALGVFDPKHFKDFIWRAFFAKSLHEADAPSVTNREFRILRWPWSSLNALGVVSAWMGRASYVRLDTAGVDVLLVETPFPARPKEKTKLIVRYHDAIPLFMPHTIKDRGYHRSAHYQALLQNVADGAWFACVSESTRRDLIAVIPEVEPRTVTIPNMVSHHFFPDEGDPTRIAEIIWSRKNRSAPHRGGGPVAYGDQIDGQLDYLLMVGTIEPRKNHLLLIDAWERLRGAGHRSLQLVFVGSFGWEHHAIVQRAEPWLERGGLHLLENVPAGDLRLLYRHARVTVCPSFGEGFDFPGVEAMRCGGVVAASDIPVHRDVFHDACAYFDPYSVEELIAALNLAAERRLELLKAGAAVSERYLPERVLPLWGDFIERVAA